MHVQQGQLPFPELPSVLERDARLDATSIDRLSADDARSAARSNAPLRIRGGGSKDFYGEALRGERAGDRARSPASSHYEPTELVVTARGGTPLAELEAALAEKGQCLPFEPPHFGAARRARSAACVAAGLSGPRAPLSAPCAISCWAPPAQRRGRGAAFRRPGDEERGRLRRVAPARGIARHARADPRGVAQGAARAAARTTTLRLDCRRRGARGAHERWAGKPLPLHASAGGTTSCACGSPAPMPRCVRRTRRSAASHRAGRGRAASGPHLRDQHTILRRAADARRRHAVARSRWRRTAPPLPLPGEKLIEWAAR